jgi:hypothetical protein
MEEEKEVEDEEDESENVMKMVGLEPRSLENRIRQPPPPQFSPIGIQQR